MSGRIVPYSRLDSLSDSYEIGDLLAKGGFSEVFKGIHKKSGGPRAIKIMEKSILTGKRGMMVARETEILRRCSHPNLLTLYEVVETPTQMCLIMELVTGGDLYDYIVQRKSLTEEEAAKIIKAILKAVEYLHNATPPVVHRDIKPENVLIEDVQTERVMLSDFGLSKILNDPKMVECTPGGTSFYLPPEIIEGIKKHGARPRPTNVQDMKSLDLWSTGIVLYILLCGSPPFKGSIRDQAERQRLLNQINQGVSFPDNKWAGVSEQAKNLVSGLLQVEATKRLTVRQALAHPWILQRDSMPVQLKTPNIFLSEYKSKKEFNDEVDGACKGAHEGQKERKAAEKQIPLNPAGGSSAPAPQRPAFNPMQSSLVKARQMKNK
jgi:serine/threonine protein kinase|uniref:Protein kinase domain-containing protein n=1 Tax=Eutreptiella gymnastica TaxID=73025 RepID=A0A7S4CFX7_9EUGL|mmetsp:Transcript_10591/g.19947  ORF Transcript_10591/g.19947 Transcript_10591/m.19947 type:complete len:379 (-) Transcript_10591:857-1993(-)|eukprot:CAMPEP_0174288396 /NCGR_PEP_ID=MMETSP0809-20121228/20385_1 /TAXON_ID=73025 ORGANISM="Eutreptiella gymnastica-like, Strain CCMP1594" /NCGR_SAMPLE_ID=MMETSP0809 /ASSEMBLY_ACC=CAM_ASM_000658 /LENGTH=378 /DNA_ID=CAMNT_0015385539 /DNA_START=22 /DNA_END=1158 /DNA_ORIENTATION=-